MAAVHGREGVDTNADVNANANANAEQSKQKQDGTATATATDVRSNVVIDPNPNVGGESGQHDMDDDEDDEDGSGGDEKKKCDGHEYEEEKKEEDEEVEEEKGDEYASSSKSTNSKMVKAEGSPGAPADVRRNALKAEHASRERVAINARVDRVVRKSKGMLTITTNDPRPGKGESFQLGKGAYGKVQVVKGRAGQLLATKVVKLKPKSKGETELALTKLALREVETLVHVKGHPNILNVHPSFYFRDSDKCALLCLNTEVFTGGSLQQFVSTNGRLYQKQAMRVAYQLASALSHCHSKNVVSSFQNNISCLFPFASALILTSILLRTDAPFFLMFLRFTGTSTQPTWQLFRLCHFVSS